MNDYLCNAALRLPEAGVVQRGELVWTGGVLKAARRPRAPLLEKRTDGWCLEGSIWRRLFN